MTTNFGARASNREPSRARSGAATRLFLACAVLLAAAAPATACNIPVFRYALERWRPDPFDAVVFQRGELNESQRAIVEAWRKRSIEAYGLDGEADPANLDLTVVDLDSPKTPEDLRKLWETATSGEAEPTLPLVVLRAPGDPRKPLVAWRGPLADDALQAACDSPTRRELRQRLLAGHSVVWLVLPGRDADQHRRVADLLAEQLPILEQKISLPEGIGTDGFDLLTDVPLEIKFSALAVDRDAAVERTFLELLAVHFPAVRDREQTLLLPVFGCGRVLDVIEQKDVDAGVLADASEFLCGACSCQVKNLNPGFDLLVAADWDKLLALAGQPIATESPGVKDAAAPSEPKYVPIPRSSSNGAEASQGEDRELASAARRTEGPFVSATSSPSPVVADIPVPSTYGTSRANRDQPERWPTAITLLMISIGAVAVVVMVVRTRARRRKLREEAAKTEST